MRVDLGCGTVKHEGFVGIDRYPLPGVDIVHDLDQGVPLPDDAVELMVASHSLEHMTDLMATMREIYRVCRHMAVLCIVAPYALTSLNLANPYHKYAFTEDTPRFFTSDPTFLTDPADVAYPLIRQWGLAHSDNSEPGMDFRCLEMEIFHFPPYNRLPDEQKRACRRSMLNVAHSIVYWLVAVKAPVAIGELKAFASGGLYVPPIVAHMRQLEQQTGG